MTMNCLMSLENLVNGRLRFCCGHQAECADTLRFFNLEVGDPPQTIQADLDMLSPDFYTLMTTSGNGSQYNSFSKSHGLSRLNLPLSQS